MSSPLLAGESTDYFAMKAPWLVPVVSPRFAQPVKPSVHQPGANSISSITSDATLIDANISGSSDYASASTDTLVAEAASPSARRNVLLLRLSLSQRGTIKLHSAGTAIPRQYDSFSRIDEEVPTPHSHSAIESHFAFHSRSVQEQESSKHSFGMLRPSLTTPVELLSKLNVPRLRKQTTLPNLLPQHDLSFMNTIKTEQAKRCHYKAPAENMRDSIAGLSPTIKYLLAAEIASRLESTRIDPRTNLPTMFIIDIRSFADFVKGNVTGSINVCPPLTLLRRSTFNWTKCVNSLPNYERLVILNYLHFNNENSLLNTTFQDSDMGLHGLAPIFIYDNNNYSANLYHMCKKLIDNSCWQASSAPPVYLLDGTFAEFSSQFNHLITSGKSEPIDLSTLEITTLSNVTSKSCDNLKMLPLDTSGNEYELGRRSSAAAALPSFSFDTSTPTVSNFCLPQNLPNKVFKIRHNEEVLDAVAPPNIASRVSELTSAELQKLPQWLRESVTRPEQIKLDFTKLEVSEKARLNYALSLAGQSELKTPGGSMEASPVINCGLDFGHKNRYKDIFVYDHSRVKLSTMADSTSHGDCDYINASYINPTPEFTELMTNNEVSREKFQRDLKMIATQGPLKETTGDFWKCVIDQNCLIIVSLTDEFEGGFKKCSPYWTPGVYRSGMNILKVDLRKEQVCGVFTLRLFTVSCEQTQKHVLQVHLNKWQDMSASVDPKDILAIVLLKENILEKVKPTVGYSTITHCSAGCGRTGVFCTVDSVVGLLRSNNNHCELPYDPVYSLVNSLRRQRILMVQNVRQYGLIYDVLVQYALAGTDTQALGGLDIVQDFYKVLSD